MNLVNLVAFENFEWLLLTAAVIYSNCNFTKQYWSNILSYELSRSDIWTPPAISSRVKGQWKVCYNKLKQGNFPKTDVGSEIQGICQELVKQSPVVILNHFCLRYLGDSEKYGDNSAVYANCWAKARAEKAWLLHEFLFDLNPSYIPNNALTWQSDSSSYPIITSFKHI